MGLWDWLRGRRRVPASTLEATAAAAAEAVKLAAAQDLRAEAAARSARLAIEGGVDDFTARIRAAYRSEQ